MESHARQRGARYRSPGYADTIGRVAANVRRLREELGLTQEQVAARAAGMAPRLYRQIEGARTNLTAATLTRLAEALGVDVASLLVPSPPPPKGRRGRPRKRPRSTRAGPAASAETLTTPSRAGAEKPDAHLILTDPRDAPAGDVLPPHTSAGYSMFSQAGSNSLAEDVIPYGRPSELDRPRTAPYFAAVNEAAAPIDPAVEAELLRRRLDELRVELTARREELVAESARLDMTLMGLGVSLGPSALAPRVAPTAVTMPAVPKSAHLRQFLAHLLAANPRGLLTVEMAEAARTAGRRPGKNEIHALVRALYESGDLTREGRRGAYVYQLREGHWEGSD